METDDEDEVQAVKKKAEAQELTKKALEPAVQALQKEAAQRREGQRGAGSSESKAPAKRRTGEECPFEELL
eukprot:9700454-Prorocentrum_lima.AAC.1